MRGSLPRRSRRDSQGALAKLLVSDTDQVAPVILKHFHRNASALWILHEVLPILPAIKRDPDLSSLQMLRLLVRRYESDVMGMLSPEHQSSFIRFMQGSDGDFSKLAKVFPEELKSRDAYVNLTFRSILRVVAFIQDSPDKRASDVIKNFLQDRSVLMMARELTPAYRRELAAFLDPPVSTGQGLSREEQMRAVVQAVFETDPDSIVLNPLSWSDIQKHPDRYAETGIKRVSLFDLDGTIVRVQTTIEAMIEGLLRRGVTLNTGVGWWKLSRAILSIVIMVLQEVKPKDGHAEGVDQALFAKKIGPLLKGADMNAIEAAVSEIHKLYGMRKQVEFAVRKIKHDLKQGDLVMLVSGAPDFRSRMYAEELGIPVGNILSTRVGRDSEGIANGEIDFINGKTKKKNVVGFYNELSDYGITIDDFVFHTDSPSDTSTAEWIMDERGGFVFGVRPKTESFGKWILAKGGATVTERDGIMRVTFGSVGGAAMEAPVIYRAPSRLPDFVEHLGMGVLKAASFGVAAAVVEGGYQAIQGHGIQWMQSASSAADAALAALPVTLAVRYFLPSDAPVSNNRRVFLGGMAPLMAIQAGLPATIATMGAAFVGATVACLAVEPPAKDASFSVRSLVPFLSAMAAVGLVGSMTNAGAMESMETAVRAFGASLGAEFVTQRFFTRPRGGRSVPASGFLRILQNGLYQLP